MAPASYKRTAGTWDSEHWPVYFAAVTSSWFHVAAQYASHVLIAVNEMKQEEMFDKVRRAVDAGVAILIDSGIFALTQVHARLHNVGMDEALALAPDEIDGFDELMTRYLRVVRELGDKAWGYIELDQGGRENKIKTRTKLEAQGLSPMPVYHPLNDGWDYFDYLAQRYDRICFGNVVQANPHTRRRLLVTAYERAARYPHLWIHLLGVTPTHWVSSLPLHSSDSSSWEGLFRYASGYARCAAEPFGEFGVEFVPVYPRQSYTPVTGLSAVEAEFVSRNVFDLREEYRREGLEDIRSSELGALRPASLA